MYLATEFFKTATPNTNISQPKDYIKMVYLSCIYGCMESRITFVTTANNANAKLKATRMNLPPPINFEDATDGVRINNMVDPPETEGSLHRASIKDES